MQVCRFCSESLLDGLPYLTCSGCGAKSLHPIPSAEELRNYYNSAYEVSQLAAKQGVAKTAPRDLAQLATAPGKRLLEIGCSYGFFLAHAQDRGWDASGIEVSEKAAAFGRRQGLNIHSGTLEDAPVSPPYDAIVSFNVIEHLIDPMRFLEQCANLLRDQGLLMLRTANVASWIARATGKYWSWHSPPAHLYLFTPESMAAAITRAGLIVERVWTQRGDANSNLYEYLVALRRRWHHKNNGKEKGASRGLDHHPLVKLARSITDAAYFPLSLTLDPWLAERNLQPELAVIARKIQ